MCVCVVWVVGALTGSKEESGAEGERAGGGLACVTSGSGHLFVDTFEMDTLLSSSPISHAYRLVTILE